MAIKRGSKVEVGFSASSMTDLIFLLLLFMMLSTTLINPNAVKLTLPKSSNQLKEKPYTTVSINSDLGYFIETTPVSFDRLEETLVAKLTGTEDPTVSLHCDETVAVGETVKLNGDSYTIVGVVERQTESSSEFDDGCMDDFVWIPYSRAVKMARNAVINNYIFTSRDINDTETCTTELKNFLYEKMKSENLYTVTAMSSLLDSLNEQIAMMSMMLGGIAGISLLVAGVGVMNIMLVSVTERTREIGIRKALGAKKSVIMLQFVIEALVTSSIGGIIGIMIGALASTGIGAIMGIDAPPTMTAVVISFSVSVAIGLIFGYMPASRAAKLNPIDALRTD